MQPSYPRPSRNLLPFFKAFRLGPVLAYNLCKAETKTRGREKLFKLLQEIPQGSRIMLCFGEIDCRAHLLKQCLLRDQDLPTVVEECVNRYFSTVKELMSLGYELLIWNVIPSTRLEEINSKDFPVYGTCAERNNVSRHFNSKVADLCQENNIRFISIFDDLVDNFGLTKMNFYMDNNHLSQRAMPFVLREMRQSLPDMSFRLPISYRCQQFVELLRHSLYEENS